MTREELDKLRKIIQYAETLIQNLNIAKSARENLAKIPEDQFTPTELKPRIAALNLRSSYTFWVEKYIEETEKQIADLKLEI